LVCAKKIALYVGGDVKSSARDRTAAPRSERAAAAVAKDPLTGYLVLPFDDSQLCDHRLPGRRRDSLDRIIGGVALNLGRVYQDIVE
jgi:hypothetical protein